MSPQTATRPIATSRRAQPSPAPARVRLQVGLRLTWAVAVLAAASSLATLFASDASRDGIAAGAGLRGASIVNLLAAAVLVVVATRGRASRRGAIVWVGTLAYLTYASAYAVFGPTFNALFVADVLLFAGTLFALVFVVSGLPVEEVAAGFAPSAPARIIGGLWVVVAAALAWAWGSAAIGFALGGAAPTDVLPYPEWRVHLGYVLDLSLVAPSAAIAGVLLWRRSSWGYVLGTAFGVWMFASQLAYVAAAVALANAGVPGVSLSDPTPYITAAVFAAPMIVMLRNVRGRVRLAS